jgi:hypothetical protein
MGRPLTQSGPRCGCQFALHLTVCRLFDHLVGDGEQPRWHLDAKRARRLQVKDELELGGLHDRRVSRKGKLSYSSYQPGTPSHFLGFQHAG